MLISDLILLLVCWMFPMADDLVMFDYLGCKFAGCFGLPFDSFVVLDFWLLGLMVTVWY